MKGYRTPRGRTKAWYSRGSRTFSPAQLAELKATGQLLLLCLVGAALLISGCYFWVNVVRVYHRGLKLEICRDALCHGLTEQRQPSNTR